MRLSVELGTRWVNLDHHQEMENVVNPGSRYGRPNINIIERYMQPSTLFDSQEVSELCEARERQVKLEVYRVID